MTAGLAKKAGSTTSPQCGWARIPVCRRGRIYAQEIMTGQILFLDSGSLESIWKKGLGRGARCVLMPGTVLGPYAIAAAGSVVRGRVPEFEIHAGNPAQFVRRREIRTDVTQAAAERVIS